MLGYEFRLKTTIVSSRVSKWLHKSMNDQLFQSVIELTEQRDLDSLEYCLLGTLVELLGCDEASILKVFDLSLREVEVSLRIEVSSSGKQHPQYMWHTDDGFIPVDAQINACITTHQLRHRLDSSKRFRLTIPICKGKDVIALLQVIHHADLTAQLGMITGFVKIYENYLYILSESERDKLTGLLNRRSFDNKLSRLLRRLASDHADTRNEAVVERRHDNRDDHLPAWLCIVDVDHFKEVNDTYGHVYGDEVLLCLAQMMQAFFRQSDLLFRFGGEEFVIVLSPMSKAHAHAKLEQFRQRVSQYQFPLVKDLTVSIGYLEIHQHDYPATVLDNADKAMYHAKQNGRNQIRCYTDLVESGKIQAPDLGGSVDLF